MLIEIPEIRRACFCLPLRYGIIILGYLNLGFAIFYTVIEGITAYYFVDSALSLELVVHRGVPMPVPLWFLFLLYSADIIFTVVLLIGAHKKICTFLNVFYYYSLSTTLAAFICLFVVWMYRRRYGFLQTQGHVELAFIFTNFVGHIYLLLLLRSEMKKLRNCSPYIVVNHMNEVVIAQPMEERRTISVG